MNEVPSSSGEAAAERKERFELFLHRAYSRTAGIRFFITRRLRPAGIAVGAMLMLATFLGIGHDSNAVYQFFSLNLGMILIALPWAFVRRASVEAKRELPRYGFEGS